LRDANEVEKAGEKVSLIGGRLGDIHYGLQRKI
jgi:hypothetical protein